LSLGISGIRSSAKLSPTSSGLRKANPKAFHSHYSEQFYYSHPTTFVFLDTLTKIQATTSIKIRSTSSEAAGSKHDSHLFVQTMSIICGKTTVYLFTVKIQFNSSICTVKIVAVFITQNANILLSAKFTS
jgi:hypothetical protein